MSEMRNTRIIIVEDAKILAANYKETLEKEGYDVTVCHKGEEVQSLIDHGERFDLAIMDVVLPSEDPQRYALADCYTTGLRLSKQMINKDICTRFYVITVRSSLKSEFETLCEEKRAILKFEGKLDFEPKNLIENVAELLRQPIRGAGKNLLSEFEEHVGRIEQLANRVSSLSRDEKEALMFLKKAVYNKITNSQQGKLKSHLDTADNPVERFGTGNTI